MNVNIIQNKAFYPVFVMAILNRLLQYAITSINICEAILIYNMPRHKFMPRHKLQKSFFLMYVPR